MLEFDLKEYQQVEVTNTKIKVFIEFLYKKYGVSPDTEKFDNEYFQLFNDDDFIESLRYYIEKNGITAQVTASNYIGYIRDFFKMLSEKYEITNETFTNIKLYEKLLIKSKEIINILNETESKDIATDEQYEKLNYCISSFLDNLIINDIYNEITRLKTGELKKVRLYSRFVSCISIKLIMQFALGSLATALLEIDNLDISTNSLKVNGFKLPLTDELISLFNDYLKIREYILKLCSIDESKLFIKHNGRLFVKENKHSKNFPDYSQFFMIVGDAIDSHASELFADRRILEMLNKGIDVPTISKLSGKSEEKCIKLQRTINNTDEIEKKLQIFFDNKINIENTIIPKKKNYIRCPVCNKEVHAISDELVLVQYENNPRKYLACKNCRGEYGKQSR